MTTVYEPVRAGEGLIWEAHKDFRETVTFDTTGGALAPMTIVAKNSSTGKYVKCDVDPAAANSTGVAAGVVPRGVPTVGASVKGVAIVKLAVMNDSALVYPATANDARKAVINASLSALHVKVITGTHNVA